MNYLLTGGSACGKSTYAEAIAMGCPGSHIYLATMRPYGEEGLAKIARHRRLREGKGFATLEREARVSEALIPEGATVLLECVCNLVDNQMFDEDGTAHDVADDIVADILRLSERCGNLIVVTNDVGSDCEEYSEGVRAYIDVVGRINRELARAFDNVYELVCGIPILLKGELPEGLA